jgi:hypothetical protein
LCEFLGTNSIWVGGTDKFEEGNWVWNNPTQPILLDYWSVNIAINPPVDVSITIIL